MNDLPNLDVIVVGGGIAGACMAGVLAREGLGVLVIEKEARFRDRIRGEGTWPWGVAEARTAGLGDLLDQVGLDLMGVVRYENGQPAETDWTVDPVDGVPLISFFHPQLQEAAFTWAASQGAITLRPAKAVAFSRNGQSCLTIERDGEMFEATARLVIGADGKHSMARRWTGGESLADPEHHRMGGVALTGATFDGTNDNYCWDAGEAVNWFSAGRDLTRLYVIMQAHRLRETGVDRDFASILTYAGERMPPGALTGAEQAGPIGYFSSSDTWGTRIAGNGVVLIGDAAGSPDPCQGHGTSLIFHDIRRLRDWLRFAPDWDDATAAFAADRERAFAVIQAFDRWHDPFFENTPEAARQLEGHEKAKQADPTLGGFAWIERRGPDGLVADEAARRHYFGEDLA
ncbi:MAG: NAD(P)/FAD-dependent oxidoreductase [Thermomicrobiales bacterium]